MKKIGKNLSTLKKELLADPKTKRAYDELELEFQLIDMLIKKRIKENLSQTQLANKLGIKQPVISQLERGRFNPTIKFLRRIVKALDGELDIKIR